MSLCLQHTHGGPIIAVQVENEFGSYSSEVEHLLYLKKVIMLLFFQSTKKMIKIYVYAHLNKLDEFLMQSCNIKARSTVHIKQVYCTHKADEPRYEKTGFLRMRKQRRRSASR